MKILANGLSQSESNSTVFHSDGVDYEKINTDDYLSLWYNLTELKQPNNINDALIKMFDKIKPSLLCQVLSEIVKGIEINQEGNTTEILLSINISTYNKVTLWKFVVRDKIISCIWSPAPSEWREWEDDLIYEGWALNELYFEIAEFVLAGTWYILSKYHFRKLPRYLINGNTMQDKAQGTGPIDYFMDMINDQVTWVTLKM